MDTNYYYNKQIYENTNTIIEKQEKQIENLEKLNVNLSNGTMFIGIILIIEMLHHLFDGWWKKGGY